MVVRPKQNSQKEEESEEVFGLVLVKGSMSDQSDEDVITGRNLGHTGEIFDELHVSEFLDSGEKLLTDSLDFNQVESQIDNFSFYKMFSS